MSVTLERPTTEAGGSGSYENPLPPVIHGEGDDSYAHEGIMAAETYANSLEHGRALRIVELTQPAFRRQARRPGYGNVTAIGGRLTIRNF